MLKIRVHVCNSITNCCLPAAGAEPTKGENAINFEPDLRAICHGRYERGRAEKRESPTPPPALPSLSAAFATISARAPGSRTCGGAD